MTVGKVSMINDKSTCGMAKYSKKGFSYLKNCVDTTIITNINLSDVYTDLEKKI